MLGHGLQTAAPHGPQFHHGALRGTVFRLAQSRLRTHLAETEQTIPDQVHKPTSRPTMRWVFQCFEGIELLHVRTTTTLLVFVLGLQPVHQQILHLLGLIYEALSTSSG